MIGILLIIIAACMLFGARKVRGALTSMVLWASIIVLVIGITILGNYLGGDSGIWITLACFAALAIWGLADPVVGGRD